MEPVLHCHPFPAFIHCFARAFFDQKPFSSPVTQRAPAKELRKPPGHLKIVPRGTFFSILQVERQISPNSQVQRLLLAIGQIFREWDDDRNVPRGTFRSPELAVCFPFLCIQPRKALGISPQSIPDWLELFHVEQFDRRIMSPHLATAFGRQFPLSMKACQVLSLFQSPFHHP
jgi:hypothetical protein